MLIQFDSECGSLSMFGDVAVQLLKLMGHSGTVPSAILARDIPGAVERLERGLATASLPPAPASGERAADENEVRVSLKQRAYPLLELLKRAAAKNCDVMWKQAGQ